MILFDYKCSKCQHENELLANADYTNSLECPKCKSMTYERQISAPKYCDIKGEGAYKKGFQVLSPK